MKGYEDLIAGLLLLVVVLVCGYTYLQSEVFKQKQILQVPLVKEKPIAQRSEKTIFEVASKTTE
jgi:hypothetical protein